MSSVRPSARGQLKRNSPVIRFENVGLRYGMGPEI
ncbi:MAG TPA: cell division ATP-binding protein FtsE, partial [Ochrobactrum sp.]|nr:cell division ATP-binding protein FtsE [Ochrobactrum sp.]